MFDWRIILLDTIICFICVSFYEIVCYLLRSYKKQRKLEKNKLLKARLSYQKSSENFVKILNRIFRSESYTSRPAERPTAGDERYFRFYAILDTEQGQIVTNPLIELIDKPNGSEDITIESFDYKRFNDVESRIKDQFLNEIFHKFCND